MGFTVIESTGNILSAKLTGELTVSDMRQLQAAAAEAIKRLGRIKGLAILDDFRGWKRDGNWGDMTFLIEHDKNIAKMAVVGEEKWKDSFYAFLAKGFRQAEIEYFLPSDVAKARAWLEADANT
jgi:hypothetical protein